MIVFISSSPWSTAYEHVFKGENNARLQKRDKELRNRHSSLQTEIEREVIMELWKNDLDSLLRNLKQWIRVEVRKKIPCAWGFNVLGETLNYLSINNLAFPSFDTNYCEC